MKIGTLFSGGLAAPEFAFKYEDIKHEVVFACEWDKYARKQYLAFHGTPGAFYNDVSEMDGTPYKNQIDLMVWGSPCQDLSLAGKRKGFDGEKSSLFREGARVMSEVMPKVFIFENVKGLLSSNGGSDYKEVVKTFQDMGYLIASKVLNAKEYGTAQNRERVFIVGFLDVQTYHDFSFESPVLLTKCLRDYLEDEVDEKYYLSEDRTFELTGKEIGVVAKLTDTKFESAQRIQGVEGVEGVAATLITQQGGDQEPKILVKSATKQGYEVATQNDSINFTHPDSKTRRGRVGKGVAQTLDCSCNQGVIINPLKGKTEYGWHFEQKVYSEDSCTRALTASEGSGSREKVIQDNFKIRRLTPRECFRLQGIKDQDIKLINSDTQSYKIAGNAIEVNTMRSVLRALYKPTISKGSLF